MAAAEDVNTPVIALVGFLGTTLVFALVVLLEVLFYHAQSQQFSEKDLHARPLELTKLLEGQQAELAEYRWVDPEKKVVAIPISRAMELVVRDLATQARPQSEKTPSSERRGAKERDDGV